MDERTLIAFIERIIHNCGGDTIKATYSLSQLKTIIEEQQTSPQLISIATKALRSAQELSEYAKKPHIDAVDLEEADRRAELRIKREEELRQRGRC
ncbi:MAG: hypothetical protein MJ130_01240 [Lachnospiraceae bacterium]|nr:hypothetical protein [Lachnospiraceae bacterium]